MELGKILIVLKNNKGGKMNSIKKLNKAQLCVGCGICKAALNDCVDLKLEEAGKFSIENTKDWTEENIMAGRFENRALFVFVLG